MNLRRTRIDLPRFHTLSIARAGALLGIAMLVAASVGTPITAQTAGSVEAAPPLQSLEFPELRLVATDEGFEAPREIAPGRYLVMLENRGTPDGPAATSDVTILQLPAGVRLDDLNALLSTEGAAVPGWFGDIVSTGGFNVAAGETGYAVLDLQAGEWAVGVGDTNPFVPLTVTSDEAASDTPITDPAADLTIELSDSAFDLPDQLQSGRQVWHATNSGEQLHELVLVKTPELVTVEQVLTIVGLPEGDTLPPGMPDPATFDFLAAGMKPLSPGHEIWIETELAPGYYVALCLVPDAESGAPHAMLGMVNIFTVSEPAVPAA